MSAKPPNGETKFRPYLTLAQIDRILHFLKGSPEPEDSDLISALEVLIWKANRGLTKPAYTSAPTLAQRLELDPAPAKRYTLNEKINLYVRWKSLHAINSDHTVPANAFSAEEFSVIQEYRYTAGLMSQTESDEFETGLMKAATSPTTVG